jgi:hypothetical protein
MASRHTVAVAECGFLVHVDIELKFIPIIWLSATHQQQL